MAEQIGIKFVLTHTGSRSDGKPSIAHKLNWTKETWDMSVAALKQILADTSGSKVALAVEAVNTTNCNSPAAHVRLKKDVGNDRIKVTLDPTNMLYAGNVFRTTELLNSCFHIIPEDDIMYAHAKDVKWTEMLPGLNWVIPGQGEMDYETYLTHLSRLKYPRPLMLEFLNREQYPEAKKFVEDTAAKLGVKIYN
jgi:sugar phosphate isomerase/epimerase